MLIEMVMTKLIALPYITHNLTFKWDHKHTTQSLTRSLLILVMIVHRSIDDRFCFLKKKVWNQIKQITIEQVSGFHPYLSWIPSYSYLYMQKGWWGFITSQFQFKNKIKSKKNSCPTNFICSIIPAYQPVPWYPLIRESHDSGRVDQQEKKNCNMLD